MTTFTDIPACTRCKSRPTGWNMSQAEHVTRFACGSKATQTTENPDGEFSFLCEIGDKAVCSNCQGVRCMHIVCRDWYGPGIDECDGWCCPDCRPVDHDEELPDNWREL